MKVGLVYDPIYLEHDTGNHVENSQRLAAIMSHLEETKAKVKLTLLPPRPAAIKEVDSALCLVRPPGHHALRSRAMGFCIFNNVAMAAKFALSKFNISRVLIVDFDVHHGNG